MMTLALEDETFPALIVDVDPPHLFSYRWAMGHPGQRPTDQNSTLVQFVITPDGDGTVLQVIESGFATANIPADRTEKASAEFHAQGGVLDAAGLVHGQKQGRERRYEVRSRGRLGRGPARDPISAVAARAAAEVLIDAAL